MTTLDERPADDGPRPMRKDAARNRELLLAAGREVFAKRGLEASLDDIARQAGVGVGTAYRHFANKFDLAEAIMREALDEVVTAACTAARADDPWDGLIAFLETVIAVQTKDRGLREVMLGVGTPHKSDEVYEMLGTPIRTIVTRAQESGAVRPEVGVSDLGFVIAMLCEASDLAGDVGPDLWRRWLPTLLAGLRPGGPELPGTALDEEQFREASEKHHALKFGQTS